MERRDKKRRSDASSSGAIEAPPISIREAVDGYNNTLIAKGTDWVTQLCLGLYILYGCAKCHIYPLKSNKWYRLGWTQERQGQTYTKEGQWRCGNCLHRWTWGEGGTQRMLVAGSPDDDEVFCSYVGTVPDDLELQLGLLKTATLLKEVKGKQVTKKRILEAIQILNDEVAGRLGQFLPTKTYRSQKVGEASSVPIYCEDPRLALEHPGQQYKAFTLPVGFDPQPLHRDDLQQLIACAASFLDMRNDALPKGSKTRQAFRALMAARENVLSKL